MDEMGELVGDGMPGPGSGIASICIGVCAVRVRDVRGIIDAGLW
jgi:hypothetical protein